MAKKDEIEFKKYFPDMERYVDVTRKGKTYVVSGVDVVLFPIAVLAEAIDRDAKTIRRWEKEGIFPKPQWKTPDMRCKRWYSKDQILRIHELYRTLSKAEYGFSHSPHFDLDGFLKGVKSFFYRVDAERVAKERQNGG